MVLAALVILPTTWLRSLGALAYVSLGGVMVSIVLIGCVVWVGEIDGVGFHESGQLVNWEGLTTAVSLFAFCYCAHGVMPTLINSMNDRSQFGKVTYNARGKSLLYILFKVNKLILFKFEYVFDF